MRTHRSFSLATALLLAAATQAQKKPLDHSVYDGWKSIRGTTLSRDGKWLAYLVAPQEGDAVGKLRSNGDGKTIDLPRASTIQFTKDSKFALATVVPGFEEARKARRDNVKAEDQPKSALLIIDLATGKQTTLDRVTSFTLPSDDAGWIAYRPEPPKPVATPAVQDKKEEEKKTDGEDQRPGGRPGAGAPGGAAPATRGATYMLRQLATGKETKLEFVDAISWSESAERVAYSTVGDKDGKGAGIEWLDLTTGAKTEIFAAKGKYPRIAWAKSGDRLAFTTDKDDQKAKKPALSLYLYELKTKQLFPVPVPGKDASVNEGAGVSFSESGNRLLFSTSARPVDEPENPVPADERVSVDIWSFKDPLLMPAQLLQAARERTRGYQAVHDVKSGKSLQLESPEMPSVQLGAKGDGPFGLAVVDVPYRIESTWDPGFEDVYIVDLKDGSKKKLLTRVKGNYSLGTEGKTLAAYLGEKREWVAFDLMTGKQTSLSSRIPYPIWDELDDHPDVIPAYGLAGWTKGDARVLVRDKFDLWACDPTGVVAPVNLTNGRLRSLRFSPIDLDPEESSVDPENLYLTVQNDDTKEGGIYRRTKGAVTKLVAGPKNFGIAGKAKDADVVVMTRQDVTEYPDLWVTNLALENPVKVSEANPQQKDYNWLKAELVEWTSSDGIRLKGMLFKPENFDYAKKYPMITYFYERDSDTLFQYRTPAPSASTINIPLFVSQGYLVFVPDITYKVGDPGLSALNAIVPGVNSIVSRGYADPKRLGIQGQSWGGYQVAYLVTVTNMFAAAEAGAPVSNMFSAYGGVRYGSGVLRQMQYEHGQSRIGGTPWNSFIKYVENSPVFHADRVETPLMMMHNDKDGAVPYTQGIEYYSALRRLSKPVWLVVYNEEDHNLVQRRNRKDLSIRLSQFFDHFLKGAPMPVWMSQGVPATQKGKTMGTEIPKP